MNRIYSAITSASAEELFHFSDTLFIDLRISTRASKVVGDEFSAGDLAQYLFDMAKDETARLCSLDEDALHLIGRDEK